ncbi:YjbH domain-containing protein [Thioclava sp. BHET1]|nr:YjbH domain-containing protein [Thioclava sp. BHET1]
MKRITGGAAIAALLAGMGFAVPAGAEDQLAWSIGTLGAPGAIDTPTAEAFRDGELVGSVSGYSDSQRGNFSFQVFPRLTATMRFSREKGLGAGGDTLKDRSFDLHMLVLKERDWQPSFAIGLRDMFGNARYGSEYIVASKTLTPRLRASLGWGWGRLGSGGSGGGTRPAPNLDGGLNNDAWFKGPSAPFASVIWQATDKIRLKAEYNDDDYAAEAAANGFDNKTPLNFGIDYQINSMASVSGYVLHGSKVGVQFNIALDPRQPAAPSGLERAPLPVKPRPSRASDPSAYSTDWAQDPTAQPAIQKSIGDALKKDGQVLEAMKLTPHSADLRISNETYRSNPQAIGHAARIASRALPASVDTIKVTLMEGGMPASTTTLKRSDIERLENGPSTKIAAVAKIGEAERGNQGYVTTPDVYPRLLWGIAPYLELSPFDPDNSLHADVGVTLSGRYEFAPGLVVAGALRQKAIGNLKDNPERSTSTAPHVRSDIYEYQRHGDLTVPYLTFASYGRPARDVYSRVTVGLLERMYGGASGELLWKPVDSRLALGAEMNWVKQRDFDQRFSFRDYDTVTGFLSAYYDFGSGLTGELDVGRYLAKDWGATITLDRELANGWKVGAWATFTDMSTSEFGPGKFDKGIQITIPLGYATGMPSLKEFTTTLRPYVGDGGARVNVNGRLYETIEGSHQGGLYEDWGRFWR